MPGYQLLPFSLRRPLWAVVGLLLTTEAAAQTAAPPRLVPFRQGRRFGHGQTPWNRKRLTFRHRYILCIAAAIDERADLVADFPTFDIFTRCNDLSGNFKSGQK